MKSIMVTGGCGMIGSNLVKRLVKEGWDVYVADNLWRGKLEYLNDENGKIMHVFDKFKTTVHHQVIVDYLKKL